jgi:hypothetical protein
VPLVELRARTLKGFIEPVPVFTVATDSSSASDPSRPLGAAPH